MAKKTKLVPLDLGDMPVDKINAALGTELEPGKVAFSVNAQIHASRKHQNEYGKCLPHVGTVVNSPLYIGDDVRNEGKIELISRIPALGECLLVAICVEVGDDGTYFVASMYPVSEQRVTGRFKKGFLKRSK